MKFATCQVSNLQNTNLQFNASMEMNIILYIVMIFKKGEILMEVLGMISSRNYDKNENKRSSRLTAVFKKQT